MSLRRPWYKYESPVPLGTQRKVPSDPNKAREMTQALLRSLDHLGSDKAKAYFTTAVNAFGPRQDASKTAPPEAPEDEIGKQLKTIIAMLKNPAAAETVSSKQTAEEDIKEQELAFEKKNDEAQTREEQLQADRDERRRRRHDRLAARLAGGPIDDRSVNQDELDIGDPAFGAHGDAASLLGDEEDDEEEEDDEGGKEAEDRRYAAQNRAAAVSREKYNEDMQAYDRQVQLSAQQIEDLAAKLEHALSNNQFAVQKYKELHDRATQDIDALTQKLGQSETNNQLGLQALAEDEKQRQQLELTIDKLGIEGQLRLEELDQAQQDLFELKGASAAEQNRSNNVYRGLERQYKALEKQFEDSEDAYNILQASVSRGATSPEEKKEIEKDLLDHQAELVKDHAAVVAQMNAQINQYAELNAKLLASASQDQSEVKKLSTRQAELVNHSSLMQVERMRAEQQVLELRKQLLAGDPAAGAMLKSSEDRLEEIKQRHAQELESERTRRKEAEAVSDRDTASFNNERKGLYEQLTKATERTQALEERLRKAAEDYAGVSQQATEFIAQENVTRQEEKKILAGLKKDRDQLEKQLEEYVAADEVRHSLHQQVEKEKREREAAGSSQPSPNPAANSSSAPTPPPAAGSSSVPNPHPGASSVAPDPRGPRPAPLLHRSGPPLPRPSLESFNEEKRKIQERNRQQQQQQQQDPKEDEKKPGDDDDEEDTEMGDEEEEQKPGDVVEWTYEDLDARSEFLRKHVNEVEEEYAVLRVQQSEAAADDPDSAVRNARIAFIEDAWGKVRDELNAINDYYHRKQAADRAKVYDDNETDDTAYPSIIVQDAVPAAKPAPAANSAAAPNPKPAANSAPAPKPAPAAESVYPDLSNVRATESKRFDANGDPVDEKKAAATKARANAEHADRERKKAEEAQQKADNIEQARAFKTTPAMKIVHDNKKPPDLTPMARTRTEKNLLAYHKKILNAYHTDKIPGGANAAQQKWYIAINEELERIQFERGYKMKLDSKIALQEKKDAADREARKNRQYGSQQWNGYQDQPRRSERDLNGTSKAIRIARERGWPMPRADESVDSYRYRMQKMGFNTFGLGKARGHVSKSKKRPAVHRRYGNYWVEEARTLT